MSLLPPNLMLTLLNNGIQSQQSPLGITCRQAVEWVSITVDNLDSGGRSRQNFRHDSTHNRQPADDLPTGFPHLMWSLKSLHSKGLTDAC